MYPDKVQLSLRHLLLLISLVGVVVILGLLAPSYWIQQNEYHNWELMFKHNEYHIAKAQLPYPDHPMILQLDDLFDRMSNPLDSNGTVVDEILESRQEMRQTFSNIVFGSGIDLFQLLLLSEEYELKKLLLHFWKVRLSEQELPDYERNRYYNMGEYDISVSAGNYMKMCEKFKTLIAYRLNRRQFDEGIQLIKTLRESLQILDPAPDQFFGYREIFNELLLLDVIYQNPWLVKTYPNEMRQFETSLLEENVSLQQPDTSYHRHEELNYLKAYVRGVQLFWAGAYWGANDQFQIAAQTNINTSLKELAMLMQARCYFNKILGHNSADSIEMWITDLNQVMQRVDYPNYANDIHFYLQSARERKALLGYINTKENQVNSNTQIYKNRPPELTLPRTQDGENKPLTRKDLIQILRTILSVLQYES